MYREHTKVVKIGNRVIGGGNPILIQSMTNTKTEDVPATVRQIKYLREYAAHYQIKLPENFPEMTRSEASRLTDRLIATYGKMP